jgi:hypothetical protein
LSLAWRQARIERQTVSITQQVDLGTETTDRATKCMIRRFICSVTSIVWCTCGNSMRTDDRSVQCPL